MKKRLIALLLAAVVLAGCAGTGDPLPTQDETREPVRVPVESTGEPDTGSAEETIYGPTAAPTEKPTEEPIYGPTTAPTEEPTEEPIYGPTTAPTTQPTAPTEPPEKEYPVAKSYQPNLTKDSGRLSYDTPDINLDTNGLGYVGITLKNTSSVSSLTVYFTTDEDPNFTIQKSITVDLAPTGERSKRYVVDISELYGFTSSLKNIRVLSTSIYNGSLTLEKVEIYKDGSLIPPFTLTDEALIATRDEMKASSAVGQSYYPDGIMSALSNGDGTYTFISSGPLNGRETITAYKGTLDNPVQSLHYEARQVQNSPFGYGLNEFNYVSVGQVYRFSGSECFTILHLEHHFDSNQGFDADGVRTAENNTHFIASLALGYSPDNGETWYYCGEFATHTCESVHPYYGFGSQAPVWMQFSSRDAGNGPFVIKDGYVYVYMIDYDVQYRMGLAVLRADLNAVIAAARAKNTAQLPNLFKKYYNGSFSEPSIAGKSTSVIDDECPPNFTSIIYSTYLNKYVLARCSSPAYATNDGDMVLNISADLTNFRGNNYYIDTDPMGSQYPTLMAPSGENPTFETGQTVYLYYISAVRDDRFLWDKADIVRRTITFK